MDKTTNQECDGHAARTIWPRIIRHIGQELAAAARSAPALASELRREGSPEVERLVARVLETRAVSRAAFVAALAAAPELDELLRSTFRAVASEEPDPGPYDRLSSRDPANSYEHVPGLEDEEPK